MEIIVNYQCWSCGQEWSVWEDWELPQPVPEITKGIICEKCRRDKMKTAELIQKNCLKCGGKGYYLVAGNLGRGLETLRLYCFDCNGTGMTYEEKKSNDMTYDPTRCFCGKDHTKDTDYEQSRSE
jgi:hypothetical protein